MPPRVHQSILAFVGHSRLPSGPAWSRRAPTFASGSLYKRSAFFIVNVLVAFNCSYGASAQTPQEHVHGMSHAVMPFDLSKTTHIFTMTDVGGVERVIVKDMRDADQVSLVRQHLRAEARRFQRGDYSDPATLHGATMPGLAELQAGAKQIRVKYGDLRDGGEITFETGDRHLLTAIHRWFGAQLSEHGADAKAR